LIEGDGKEKHKCEKGRRLSCSFDMEFFIGDFLEQIQEEILTIWNMY
jgi:hypothetical protein